jgi:hypothetical protein
METSSGHDARTVARKPLLSRGGVVELGGIEPPSTSP